MVSHVNVNDVYTDLSGLNAIKAAGREDADIGMRKVAEQFESLFLNMMLKTMRESNKVFSEGNYLSSNEMEIHQQNFDNQLSLHLSSGNGIGLADVLHRQLMQQYEIKASEEAAITTQKNTFDSPESYVEQVLPLANKAAKELGVAPEFLVAQSALESGWGSKIASDSHGASSNNVFGIKADRSWSGPVAHAPTVEFNGDIATRQNASFRKYDSIEDSFTDYIQFLKSNPRYSSALKETNDPAKFADALQSAGYATDPLYSQKIQSVINSAVMKNALLETNS